MKNVSIRVCPPLGQIRVSAPLHYRQEKVLATLRSKVDWMSNQQQRFLRIHQTAIENPPVGNSLFFLQKCYAYEFVEHTTLRGPVYHANGLHIYVKPGMLTAKRELEIKRWYLESLTKYLSFFVQKWSLILNVKVASWNIRQMKTKWGSCNITEQKIVFNLELIKHSVACIEYVVVHELIHLIEPSHNARFKRFMSETVPNWKQLKEDLHRNHLLMEAQAKI